MPTDIHALFALLEEKQLRYVVVGGLALVLHGVDRLTADVDLAVDLSPEAAGQLVEALAEAGYRPAAPVMQVFSYWDTTGRRPTIDIFIASPIPFGDLWRDTLRVEISSGLRVPVASVAHLIRLKELAGRPQDLADIERLREL